MKASSNEAHVDGRGQVGPGQVGGAEQRMSDTPDEQRGRQGLAGANSSSARSASASARSTPSIIMNARRRATLGAIVALPSESGMVEVAPSASESHRWASAGRP